MLTYPMLLDLSKQTRFQPALGKGFYAAFALFVLLCSTTGLYSQQPAADTTMVYVVAHVDVVPSSADTALALLKTYGASCHQVSGAQRFEVLRQVGRPNHFTLVEVWQSEAARQANEESAATRRFRDQLQPLLGSPFDERLQQLAQP